MPGKQWPMGLSLVLYLLVAVFSMAGCNSDDPAPPATATFAEPATIAPQSVETNIPPTATTAPTVELAIPEHATSLTNLLRFVPHTPEYRRYLTFGDYDAWLQSWEIDRPANMADIGQMNERDNDLWALTLSRQTTPPRVLVQYINVEAMIDTYGFDFFGSHQYLEAGTIPGLVTVMTQSSASNDIGQALMAVGYQAKPLDDTTVLYSIREDYQLDIASETRTGRMGELNRIAISNDMLVIGRGTAVVEAAIDSAGGSIVSLADAPDYQAFLRSLDAPELVDVGPLVGAILQGEPVLVDVANFVLTDNTPEEIVAQWEQIVAQDPALPAYTLAGFVTYRAPKTTYLALHTVFPSSEDADLGADILTERLQNYISILTESPLPWSFDRVFTVEETAVIVMRLDETKEQPDSLSWSEMVATRDTIFLISE